MKIRIKPRSLAFRLVMAATLWITLALAGGGVLISALFRVSVEENFDARLAVHLDSLLAVSELDPAGALGLARAPGEPRFELPYSGWYWQISDHQGAPLLRSRSLWDQILDVPAAQSESGVQRGETTGPVGEVLRIRFIDITLPDSPENAPPLRFAVAADKAALALELRPFNQALFWSLLALGIGLAVAVTVQVAIGLRPLRRIQVALADVRSGRADRMKGDWPDEVQPLITELDALLDHNDEVIGRARTHVGNLAHALKTPLAVLANEGTRKDGARTDAVSRQVAVMHRWIDHYLGRARTAATGAVLGARTPVAPVVEDLRRTLLRIHLDRAPDITSSVAGNTGTAVFRGERQDLEEMLGNLLDNACKWAGGRIDVAVSARGRVLTVTIDDDGPGLPAERRAEAMGRGRRLDEAAPGSGLGLAIVADIARLYGGELRLDESPMGGLRAELTLPAAAG